MRRMNSPVCELWKRNTMSEFNKSALGTLVKKPNNKLTEAMMQKTQALKLMSLDICSAAQGGKKPGVYGRAQ